MLTRAFLLAVGLFVPTTFSQISPSSGFSALRPAVGGEPAYELFLPSKHPHPLRSHLETLGYGVSCCAHEPNGVTLVASAADRAALEAAGLQTEVRQAAAPLRDILAVANGGPSRLAVPTGYRDLAAIQAHLDNAALTHPSLAKVFDAAATWGPGSTFEGRGIPVIKISDNVANDEDEPAVLIVSAHHCREIVTPEICLDIIDRLLSGYGSDPNVTDWVNRHEIWIAPIWNPDGLEYVWNVNNLWRKNRKPFASGQFGVDLNRNYDLGWGGCGSSGSPSSDTYRGPSAESEEETQTMVGFARDRRFAKVIDFHSSGREVLLSYDCVPMPPTMETWVDSEAVTLANAIGYGTREPSADAEHQHWQTKEITAYAFLVETETSFQPPHSAALAEAALVWPLVQGLLSRPLPIEGHVTDATTGLPVVAEISVSNIGWLSGETRFSEPRFGRYHLNLPPGSYTVTFTAPNRAPVAVPVTVSNGGSVLLDVTLPPPGFTFDMSTSGQGLGDFAMSIQGMPQNAEAGFTVFSLLTAFPAGQGPVFGIAPDTLSLSSLTSPPSPTNPFHFVAPFQPGSYPLSPLTLPPGSILLSPGTQLDGLAVILTSNYVMIAASPVRRITF